MLLEVRAAGVDMGVWHLLTGRPYLLRFLGFGFRGPKSPVPGRDVAGVVSRLGPGVTEFSAGDEVFGTCDGSFAEYAVAPVSRLARKPSVISFTEAAAVPLSGGTALQGLRGVQLDQRVLVLGAGGGVGSYGVQIAWALGAHVTGVCSTRKLTTVKSLGAHEVVDYTAADLVGPETGGPLLGGFERGCEPWR